MRVLISCFGDKGSIRSHHVGLYGVENHSLLILRLLRDIGFSITNRGNVEKRRGRVFTCFIGILEYRGSVGLLGLR